MKTGIIKHSNRETTFTALDYTTVQQLAEHTKALVGNLTLTQRMLLAGCNDESDRPELDIYWDETDENLHGSLWNNLDIQLLVVH